MSLSVGSAVAADDEMADEPDYDAVETFTCSYRDGKSWVDLEKVVAEWNAWADDNDTSDYFAAVLTPQFFGEPTFDIGWIGVWPDGNAMGAGLHAWTTSGGKVGMHFSEVITCDSHTGWVSMNLEKPPQNDDEADDSFVLHFSNCSMEEGKDFDEFLAAQEEWNAYASEHGIVGGTWVWFPIWGESDDSYDFKYIVGEDDYKMTGANWQKFADGHWRKNEELFADLLDCDISRVYDGHVVRRMEMDE